MIDPALEPSSSGRGEAPQGAPSPGFLMVVSDWDRTLAPPPGERLGLRTVKVLNQLAHLGIRLVLASGRPTPGVLNLALRNGVDTEGMYIIGFNGGSVSSAATPTEYLSAVALDPIAVGVAAELARDGGLEFLIPTPKAVYTTRPNGYFTQVEAQSANLGTAPLETWDPSADSALKAELIIENGADNQVLLELQSAIMEAGAAAELEIAAPGQLQLNAPGGTKGSRLRILCEHLGVPLSRVVAFGDNHNDLTLLQTAGLGCAVANAVPELLEAADLVVPSCEDEGVARQLSALFDLD